MSVTLRCGCSPTMSDETTPADVISACQVAEERLQDAEDNLSDGLSHALPEEIREQYRERKKSLWQYRNYLLDLRIFLEECEEAGIFTTEDIDEVAAEWIYSPDQAREEYLDEDHDTPA